ncbi:MAG: phosphoribosylanthranilate isomerase [Opitutaceae bacterium]
MSDSLTVKICGLTREQDVAAAARLGADLFGFITYEKSPRAVELSQLAQLTESIPQGQRVVVDVAPTMEKLQQCLKLGFNFFQIHAEVTTSVETLQAWASAVGTARMWLAPRLKPGEAFPEHFLDFADTFLVDTYSKSQVGGTGQTGDWGNFAILRKQYPQKQWILAGGLSPANIGEAIAQTSADHLDVNSGVERAPGIKDSEKLIALFRALGR